MSEGLDRVLEEIEELIDYKIGLKISENKLNAEAYGASYSSFERMYMERYDGNEVVEHDTLRAFIKYQQAYNDYRFNTDTNTVLSRIRYLTPQPTQSLNVGEIPAVVKNLVLTGAGVKPNASVLTPDNVAFDYNSDITKGQIVYNETDNKWYYLSLNGIKEFVTDLTVVNQDIADLKASVNTINNSIALMATKASVEALGDTVDTLHTSITQTAQSISLLATKESLNALGQRVGLAETSITQTAESIELLATKEELDALTNTVSTFSTSITQTANAIQLLATKEELNSIGELVGSMTTTVNQTAEAITMIASESNLDAINDRITEFQSSLEIMAGQISSKVSQTDFDALKNRVGNAETTISQTANSISLLATKSSVDALTGTVTNLSSSITQTANRISLLLNENGTLKAGFIIDSINGQSSAFISADKIRLSGGVSIESKVNNLTTIIEGGNITTNAVIVKDYNGIERGGLIGTNGTDLSSIGTWMNATMANRESASFYVRLNGELFCNKATIKTSSSGKRMELSAQNNNLIFYTGRSDSYIKIDDGIISTYQGIRIHEGTKDAIFSAAQMYIQNGEKLFGIDAETGVKLSVYMKNLPQHTDNAEGDWRHLLIRTSTGEIRYYN